MIIILFLYLITVGWIQSAQFILSSNDMPENVIFSSRRALRTLSYHIELVQDVVVKIDWAASDTSRAFLAICERPNYCRDRSGAYLDYPSALYKQLYNTTDCYLRNDADIVIRINPNMLSALYFGNEGRPIRWYELDLTTALLHELVHGMGMFTGFLYDDTTGSIIYFSDNARLTIYDWVIFPHFNESAPFAINNLPNTSFLTTCPLSFYSMRRAMVNTSLYIPSSFENGVSLSHVDKPFHLMSHDLLRGNQFDIMDAVTLAILEDMGYSVKNCNTPNMMTTCGYCDRLEPCNDHPHPDIEYAVNRLLNTLYFIQSILSYLP